MRAHWKQIILAAAIVAMAPAADAAERVDVDRVVACAKEPDDARRLACYDSAVAVAKAPVDERTSVSAPASAAAPAAVATPTPPVVATAEEFGVTGSAVARQRRSEQEQAQDQGETRSISATVTEVTARPYGELVVTLDNGQVWMQKDAARFPIKPGDAVTIKAGTLGSFHMANGNRSTRVTRVK